MTRPFLPWLTAVASLGCSVAASAPSRPVVLELFTSQGCSSCPPAEAYLGQLSARPDVIALAFHVDYWDDLGWRDRFALHQSVERQDIYARNLHHSTVYTPELVIDGRSDAIGGDSRAVANALHESAVVRTLAATSRNSTSCAKCALSAPGTAQHKCSRYPCPRCHPIPPTWPCWSSRRGRDPSSARRRNRCADAAGDAARQNARGPSRPV